MGFTKKARGGYSSFTSSVKLKAIPKSELKDPKVFLKKENL
ncbi:hypothetical protein [Leptospira weilii]|nr:hypothetical protein [Leptospira weilii]